MIFRAMLWGSMSTVYSICVRLGLRNGLLPEPPWGLCDSLRTIISSGSDLSNRSRCLRNNNHKHNAHGQGHGQNERLTLE